MQRVRIKIQVHKQQVHALVICVSNHPDVTHTKNRRDYRVRKVITGLRYLHTSKILHRGIPGFPYVGEGYFHFTF